MTKTKTENKINDGITAPSTTGKGQQQQEKFNFKINDRKASRHMVESLMKLVNNLKCPMCDEVYNEPATLASCGHSFCKVCIDNHCSKHSTCPYPGCKMMMSIRGRGTSFRIINPQLSQTVESVQKIIEHLNGAPDHWWMSQEVVESILQMKCTKEREQQQQFQQQQQQRQEHLVNGEEELVEADDSRSPKLVGQFRPGRHNYNDEDIRKTNDDDDDDDEPIIDLQAGEEDWS